ncbi:MAG: hypothetical protein ACO3FQ_08305 [Terrimicrobiaceae bacterium]
MKIGISILEDGGVLFEGIDPLLHQMLSEIRSAAELDDPRVEARFYQSPTTDPESEDLREDWKAFVQPDLHSAFASSREVVEADLRRSSSDKNGHRTLLIPRNHIDHWLGALNQARLALVEYHGFSEAEMGRQPENLESPRDYALLQLGIYGLIQEWLVSLLD